MAALNLKVVTTNRPPFSFASTPYEGSSNSTQYFGMLVDLLPMLFNLAGINASLTYYTSPQDAGGILVNGTWNGITGELFNGRADIAAWPLVLAPGRDIAIDLTYSYVESGIGILVMKEVISAPLTVFLKPFTQELWLSLIATVLFMALALKLIAILSPYGRYDIKEMRDLTANTPPTRYAIDSENDSFLLDTLMAVVVNPPMPNGKSWAVRLPSLAFYLFMVVVLASFTANLASYLTTQTFATSIQSLSDLQHKAVPFAVNAGGMTYGYFQNSTQPTAILMRPYLRTVSGNVAGLAALRSGKVAAYLTETPTLRFLSGQAPCDTTVVGEPFGPSVYTLGLPKGSNLTKPLNSAMLQLKLNGGLDALRAKWFDGLDTCNDNAVSSTALDVHQFAGMWYVLLAVVGFSFLWTFVERLQIYLYDKYPRFRSMYNWSNTLWKHILKHGKRIDIVRSFTTMISSRQQNSEGQASPENDVGKGEVEQAPEGMVGAEVVLVRDRKHRV